MTHNKGERIQGEVGLPRQKGPKRNERSKKEASGDNDKTPARRHYGLGRRGDNPTHPNSDERESDSKDNHQPCGMVGDTRHDVVIENPITRSEERRVGKERQLRREKY